MSVREELEKLSRLQEIDLKIDRAKKLVSSAPSAFAGLERELAAEKANLDAAEIAKAELEKQKRQIETDIMMDNDRIKNIEARLGSVTNNKEFHAASKEADKAKKAISDREKQIAELAQKILAQDDVLLNIQTRLEALDGQLQAKQSEVGSQVGEADKEIAAIAGDRASIVSGIGLSALSRYNRIRTRYGDAVALVKTGHCSACNVALPPQMYIQVQKALELLSCPNCQRLLYYKI